MAGSISTPQCGATCNTGLGVRRKACLFAEKLLCNINGLAAVRAKQGMLLGRISDSLLFSLQDDAVLTSMALEVIKSSEIEGEILNLNQVRSSLAKRLGFDITTSVPVSRYIDGVVDPLQKCL